MKNITKKERSETMIDKKMSKADFIRNWIKGNKDFSPKWMKRLFHDLSQEGYKVAKYDSIYIYSLKSRLAKLSGKKFKKKNGGFSTENKPVDIEDKIVNVEKDNHSKNESSRLYKISSLSWALKSMISDKSCDINDLKEAFKLLEYLESAV